MPTLLETLERDIVERCNGYRELLQEEGIEYGITSEEALEYFRSQEVNPSLLKAHGEIIGYLWKEYCSKSGKRF